MKFFTVLVFVLIFVTACGSKKKDIELNDADDSRIMIQIRSKQLMSQ